MFRGKTVLGVTHLSLGLSGRKLPASYSAENKTKKQFKTEIDESRRSKLSGYEMNGEEVGSGEGIQESVGGRSYFCEKPSLKSKPSRFGNIWSVGSVLDNRRRGEARVDADVSVRASSLEPKSANPQALMTRIA